ncbi:YchJ family metal-binding protein [Subtercola endophyticus]|uniref:YchJ family metal-binding protein n=1 Tax=Subtercola endophyticus TaxID=2895559 RepID=UPI001E29B1F1|nr:YchJ family metal-binding protein [Subtercola endophyticus]UFS60435.1 hypothetical protein LQ955_06735 [Subtercola endophyticus]
MTAPATPAFAAVGDASRTGGRMLEKTGTVEFVARSRLDARASALHETSSFVAERGRWFYLDGIIHEPRLRGARA